MKVSCNLISKRNLNSDDFTNISLIPIIVFKRNLGIFCHKSSNEVCKRLIPSNIGLISIIYALNLNNYFDFHVCLSFRHPPSVCPLVRPKSNFNSCSCITKCH